ncbi:MAG: ABC transporter ATP-binding protein [Halobacteriales archaeon]|nr:ABC transporter ATP-binding protein [Halobacteriales archaeon]
MTTDVHLRTTGLTRRFGAFTALDGVDFTVSRNELRGIIGPNGAGKTTFFDLVSGLRRPSDGKIWFEGTDITGMPAHQISRRGISRTLQIASAFPSLTVLENVMGAVNGTKHLLSPVRRYRTEEAVRGRARSILDRVGLSDVSDRPVGELSHGDARVLELALALSSDPDLLLLDEPTAGLATGEIHMVTDLIADLAGDVTVLLVEHNMDVVMDVADRLTVFTNGRILAEGTPEAIRGDDRVRDVYFGRA